MHCRTRLPASLVGCALLALSGCFSPEDPEIADSEGSTSTSTTAPGSTSNTTQTPTSSGSTTQTPGTTDQTTTSGTTDAETTNGITGGETTEGETTQGDACEASEICMPAVPDGWQGPLVLGAQGNCPSHYPSEGLVLFGGLLPGDPQCECVCNVASVSCQLYLENEGIDFNPSSQCESPPFEDECVSAIPVTSCSENLIDVPATPQWTTQVSACGGAAAGDACGSGGTCYPAGATAGPVCIQQAGTHNCPADFPDPVELFQGFDDTRECTSCSCDASGQQCEIDIEICSLGFEQVTLQSGGECAQLASSDGDGVSFQGFNINNNGECQPGAGSGTVEGSVGETDPVTVCCMAM